ncbi:MAG: hypothetical protein U5N53_13970 [Mycobacterium sp.]|nr:hypothetical protein [Mycobacterium sp.]
MDDLDGFVDLEIAAKRMSLTVDQVLALVRRRVLRAVDYGSGLILVEPAIISGAV